MAVNDKPMTKTQLIAELSDSTGIAKKEVINFLDSLAQIAYKEAQKKGRFTLPGFGILKLVKRDARMARNPATGESVKVPAKTVVKFTLAKVAKDSIVPPKK
ncbi:MAG: HU family DNA-binding protein [Leptospiraceae bacterium]|nr:HU family DNA-binding protein [Leptospiraceae bacterium]MCB1201678.1 HU family DNA-binding protein [Leptospiraceae bacterium]